MSSLKAATKRANNVIELLMRKGEIPLIDKNARRKFSCDVAEYLYGLIVQYEEKSSRWHEEMQRAIKISRDKAEGRFIPVADEDFTYLCEAPEIYVATSISTVEEKDPARAAEVIDHIEGLLRKYTT